MLPYKVVNCVILGLRSTKLYEIKHLHNESISLSKAQLKQHQCPSTGKNTCSNNIIYIAYKRPPFSFRQTKRVFHDSTFASCNELILIYLILDEIWTKVWTSHWLADLFLLSSRPRNASLLLAYSSTLTYFPQLCVWTLSLGLQPLSERDPSLGIFTLSSL